MISEISIQNFKSVEKLTLPLGRVNVLIGENGAGKSNILEAVALLSAATGNKLDAEFLFSRGIRMVSDRLMCSAFQVPAGESDGHPYAVSLTARNGESAQVKFRLVPGPGTEDGTLSLWINLPRISNNEEVQAVYERSPEVRRQKIRQVYETAFAALKPDEMPLAPDGHISKLIETFVGETLFRNQISELNSEAEKQLLLSHFLIYSPENTALRRFEEEGQIQPVGIRGEGLFKMLQTFGREDYAERLTELKESLELIGWFLDFRVPPNLAPGESRLQIIDRFLGNNVPLDQRSANEGFLFLLFYFAVFLSKSTPAFFAIDNVDASLNPRLCEALMRRLVELAVKYDKQVILTTHNPAVLDGLNLTDDDQRLFSIYRTHEGRTQARRIPPPKAREGDAPVRLSHAFLRGLLGGVPKNF